MLWFAENIFHIITKQSPMRQNWNNLSDKTGRTIASHNLLKKGDTVVVAVSGGVDSVVLFHYLALRKDLNLSLVVAHLNHSLRGDESDGDEQFVAGLAAAYSVRFESCREDVAVSAERTGMSLEEAGREARYRFFREVAKAAGAASIAIAHHLDDQAETVLLRLLRGSGPAGLRGMPYRSPDCLIIRPLLDVTRAEIEEYAASNNLKFRSDSSNSDLSYQRNRIRHYLLPDMAVYNPAISFRLAETASIMASDEELLSTVVGKRWQELGTATVGGVTLNLGTLSTDLTGMRFRIYRHSLEMLNGNLRRISYRHLQAVDRLVQEGPPNGILNLPDAVIVKRSYSKLTFTHRVETELDGITEISIPSEGIYLLPSGGRVLIQSCADRTVEKGRWEMIVNLAEFPFPWIIRGFTPGDRIVPRGMEGHKKVKDLFIDEKIPRSKRRTIPLFVSDGRIFWVADLRKAGSIRSASMDGRTVKVQLLEFMKDAAILA